MSDEQDTVGTQYYGSSIDDPMNYGYGGSGYGFNSDQFYDYTYDANQGYSPAYDPNFVSPYLDNPEFFGSLPGTEGSTSVADSSGNITYKYDDGSTLTVGPNGLPVGSTESPDAKGNSVAFNRALAWTSSNLGPTAAKVLQNVMSNPGASLMTALAAAKAFGGKEQTGGYNKPVPKMDMIQQRVAYNDVNRRPGEAGRRYLTNPLFVAQGDTEKAALATTAANTQATGLAAAAPQYAAPAPNPYAGKTPIGWSPSFTTGASDKTEAGKAAEYNDLRSRGFPDVAIKAAADKQFGQQTQSDWNYLTNLAGSTANSGLNAVITPEQFAAQGGIKMAQGGIADAGRYLQGNTDGMADKVPSSIDGEQPAALSHGEFVIPADVVSHLGNGNSDAGAEKLYDMMARIRKARTGTERQGREINAEEFTMGGLAAAYVGGGAVKGFSGVTGSAVSGPNTPSNTATGAGGVPLDTSRTSTLSPWVGDYVTNALGQGAAMASSPYQAYQGPLTAGPSNLQQQAFAGASDIAGAGYTPGTFTGGFDATKANQYMNPYLQASLDPQLKELQRQSDIQRVADAGRLTGAGAYGGGRQAIMESEGRRNLLDKQAGLIGSGYKSAYDTGLGQFNKEREAEEASRQFSAGFGLKSVDQLANLGNVERGITSEGLAADRAQFQEERDFGYKMPQYQLGLLSGLPIGANTTAVNQDAISKMSSDISGLAGLYQKLANLKLT